MKYTALILTPLLALTVAWTVSAQTSPSATMEREITQLFSALKTSGCAFLRNGRWHDADKANKHLQRKYDYLRDKSALTSTESFIELAATRSSVSGKDYQVRCGNEAPMRSHAWFSERLRALRTVSDAADDTTE